MQRDTKKNQGRPLVLPHGRVAERPAGVFNPISLSGRIFFCRCLREKRGKKREKKKTHKLSACGRLNQLCNEELLSVFSKLEHFVFVHLLCIRGCF